MVGVVYRRRQDRRSRSPRNGRSWTQCFSRPLFGAHHVQPRGALVAFPEGAHSALHEEPRTGVPLDSRSPGTNNPQQRTRRSSVREPAVSLSDKSNVIGGWFPSLTL